MGAAVGGGVCVERLAVDAFERYISAIGVDLGKSLVELAELGAGELPSEVVEAPCFNPLDGDSASLGKMSRRDVSCKGRSSTGGNTEATDSKAVFILMALIGVETDVSDDVGRCR